MGKVKGGKDGMPNLSHRGSHPLQPCLRWCPPFAHRPGLVCGADHPRALDQEAFRGSLYWKGEGMMMKRAVLMTVIGLGFLAACAPTTTGGVKPQINMNHGEWLAIHLKPLEELDVKYLLSEEGLKCYFPQPIRKT